MIKKLLAGAAFMAVAVLPACDTTDPRQNCFKGRPLGQAPTAVYESRQTILNGEQHYLCWGATRLDSSHCWAVRHWDHQTFGPHNVYCP